MSGTAQGSAWRLRLLLAGLVSALTELCGLGLLATAVWLLTRASAQPPLIALSVAIVAVRGLAIGRGTFRYVERLVSHDAVLRILARLRTRVFAGLAADPAATPRGDALTRLVSDVDGVQDALLRCALPAGVGVLVTLAVVGFTAAFSVPAALLIAAGMLAAGLLVPLAAYALTRRAGRRLAPARAGYATAALDAVAGAADLAAFGATASAQERAVASAGEVAALERSAGRAASALGGLGAVLPGATALAVLATVTGTGLAREMVAVLPLLALAAVEVLLPLQSAAVRYAELRTSLARIRPLLRTGAQPEPSGTDRVLDSPVALELAGVSVGYPRRPAALSAVDLDLRPGRRVAVVGPSGSGKSTLLGVLAGQLAPRAGNVRLTGADADPDVRWRAAAGVLADAHVFHTTVRENLTLGRTGFDDESLTRALTLAGLDPAPGPDLAGDSGPDSRSGLDAASAGALGLDSVSDLESAPPGASGPDRLSGLEPGSAGASGLDPASGAEPRPVSLDRVVGEDGALLSGGERRRLLVARAMVDPAPLLLLDEPTEGLDPAAADALITRLLAAAGERGVVLVTHRLVDLSGFDEVLVLDAGRVVQRGTHADLVGRPGWYARWHEAARLAEPGYALAATPAPAPAPRPV
jgi:ATP-binding cassette, subfamily C, bacterial CydC